MAINKEIMNGLKESGWNVSELLLLEQLEEIDDSDHPKSVREWDQFLLDLDLHKIVEKTGPSVNKSVKTKIIMQIDKVRNVSVEKAHENDESSKRLLKLNLSDGHTTYQAIEISLINGLKYSTPKLCTLIIEALQNAFLFNLSPKTLPGTKIWLDGSNIEMGNNFLLLSNKNCRILGGKVPELIQKWKANTENRGQPRHAGVGGAPPWVPFGTLVDTTGLTKGFTSMGISQNESAAPVSEEFEQNRNAVIAEAKAAGEIKKFQASAPNLNQISNAKQPQAASAQNRPPPNQQQHQSRGRGGGGGRSGRGRDNKRHQRDLMDFRNF